MMAKTIGNKWFSSPFCVRKSASSSLITVGVSDRFLNGHAFYFPYNELTDIMQGDVMRNLVEVCCGLDVHKDLLAACLLKGGIDEEPEPIIKEFSTLLFVLDEFKLGARSSPSLPSPLVLSDCYTFCCAFAADSS